MNSKLISHVGNIKMYATARN